MKTFKRLTAMVLAIAAMAAGMSSVAAGAMDVTEQMANVPAEDVLRLLDQMEQINAQNVTYTYPPYTQCLSGVLSPTTHYLAAMVANGIVLEDGTVFFYLNTNINSTDPTSSSLIKAGSTFAASSIGGFSSSTYNVSRRRMNVLFYPSYTTITESTVLFTYELGAFPDATLAPASSELQLNLYTSRTSVAPNEALSTSVDYTATKCIYSIGDVNRDGIVNGTDSTILLASLVNNVGPDTVNRTLEQQGYDKLAFELAGDCDGNGTVELLDVITLNQYINGTCPTLPYSN